ncbi:SURF1 family protein [Pseudarthrobacter sp. H3Y2-7]|uniref:SURF1 family cytochrome oxidase biogenesis protein n=1 Tax=Pseudarthrobacter naphthalenicus TaxID=3031328 RepID=UPI0023AEB06F|nr:SURF1 family protein [Pseudarthrobacter sp. H3Y2-7]MDE8669980.1 SURF1 family protein [Pseudarthrobacter sp. H3Y2-7]
MTYKFLFTRRWMGYLLLAAIVAAACAGLSKWQMDRRNDAVTEIRRIQQNYAKAPIPFEEARQYLEVADPEAKWTAVSLTGQYLVQDQRVVRNRPNNSAPGYEVLVPFRLASGETIVVNRGWLPIGNARSGYPDVVPEPPAGNVQVIVRLKPSEPTIDGRTAPEGQLASIALPEYARQLGYPLLTGSYGLMSSETPSAGVSPAPLSLPRVQEGSNLSYAMQWLTFGILAFVGFGYAARQQARIARKDREDQEKSGRSESVLPARREAKARKRNSSDEEEDALLDRLGI